MSSRDYSVNDFGYVFNAEMIDQIIEKVKPKNIQTGDTYEMAEIMGLQYIGEFTGEAIHLDELGDDDFHDAMLEAYRKTAVMEEETLQQYATLVSAAVHGLLLNRLFLEPMAKSEDRLRRYIELLNPEHIPLSAIKVSDIASALNFSYSHIIRLSQAVYGMPIKQYILKRKIEYAASRLTEDPNLRVRDAAWIVGIEDPQYFSRLFRNQMGCSCSEYREKMSSISGEKRNR